MRKMLTNLSRDLFFAGTFLQLSGPAERLHGAHADAAAVPAAGRRLPDGRLPPLPPPKAIPVHRSVRHDAGTLRLFL